MKAIITDKKTCLIVSLRLFILRIPFISGNNISCKYSGLMSAIASSGLYEYNAKFFLFVVCFCLFYIISFIAIFIFLPAISQNPQIV